MEFWKSFHNILPLAPLQPAALLHAGNLMEWAKYLT